MVVEHCQVIRSILPCAASERRFDQSEHADGVFTLTTSDSLGYQPLRMQERLNFLERSLHQQMLMLSWTVLVLQLLCDMPFHFCLSLHFLGVPGEGMSPLWWCKMFKTVLSLSSATLELEDGIECINSMICFEEPTSIKFNTQMIQQWNDKIETEKIATVCGAEALLICCRGVASLYN